MSEKEFGKALLRGKRIDVSSLTERVLRRDRRRMWVLGIVCVIAWMAVVMLPWGMILPVRAKLVELQLNMNPGANPSATQPSQAAGVLEAVRFGTVAACFSSMASMFVAASCTVLLIVLSRRATLRQINARLGEISSQLKAMGQGS